MATMQAGKRITPGQLLRQRSRRGIDPAKAGEGWRALSALYTELGQARSGRLDLFCSVAPDATGGIAPGLYDPRRARIELDGNILPGPPDTLDPRTENSHHAALCALHGVFVHELGHACHSRFLPVDFPEELRAAVALLEEIRMEARVIERRPTDACFLRASAKHLIATEEKRVELASSDEAGIAAALTLIEGRVLAGSLQAADAQPIVELAASIPGWTPELHEAFRRVWQDACAVADGDADGLTACARRYLELLPPEQRNGAISKELAKALIEALEAATGEAAQDATAEIAVSGSISIDQIVEAVKDDVELKRRLDQAMDELREQSGKNAAAPGGKVISADLRPASPCERIERNKLAAALKRARWRDRERTRIASEAPPGRLRTRMAVQRSAQIAHGKIPSVKPWSQSKHRSVELPRLRVAILCDTSGSMSGSMSTVSSALWVIANAVYDTGGQAAAYGFGDSFARICDPGKPPQQVFELHSRGGTDHVSDALEAAERALSFHDRNGPRLVIIVSDGAWVGVERTLASLERLRQLGVKTVHVGIGTDPYDHGTDEVVVIAGADELAEVVGAACISALREA
jgi:Mg-chelatase subunit ChlD